MILLVNIEHGLVATLGVVSDHGSSMSQATLLVQSLGCVSLFPTIANLVLLAQGQIPLTKGVLHDQMERDAQ